MCGDIHQLDSAGSRTAIVLYCIIATRRQALVMALDDGHPSLGSPGSGSPKLSGTQEHRLEPGQSPFGPPMSALGQKQTFDPASLMSALGQKQTFERSSAMSALPPKADIPTDRKQLLIEPFHKLVDSRALLPNVGCPNPLRFLRTCRGHRKPRFLDASRWHNALRTG